MSPFHSSREERYLSVDVFRRCRDSVVVVVVAAVTNASTTTFWQS